MSCEQYQNDLVLHADGELRGPASLALLAHLKGCPECGRKVYSQQQLRATVARVMGDLKAPVALHASLATLLSAEKSPRMNAPRVFRLNRPAAIAAAIALALLAVWQLEPWSARRAAIVNVHAVPVTDEGPVAIELARNVHKLHIACATLGPAHQEADLPRDAAQAVTQLSVTLGIPVLSGDQLQLASGKLRFDTVHLCNLADALGAPHRVAHFIYRAHGNEPVSLVSMPASPEVQTLKTRSIAGHDYAVLEPGASTKCHPFTILAWTANRASYMVCAPFGYDETIASVEPLRVALEESRPIPGLMLAWLDQ